MLSSSTPLTNTTRVLVFGGAGYLGSVLTGKLLERGSMVRVFDRFSFGEEALSKWRGDPRLELVKADMRDISAVMEAMQDVNAVAVLASLVGEKACDRDPRETIGVNYVATVAVAEASRYYGINRFLFASTDSAYGIQEGIMTEDAPLCPISLYAQLKALSEERILAMADGAFSPCILRMATIYGSSPRMRFDLILNILAMHAATRNKITIYGGKQWRPLVHVDDAAEAYVLALEAPAEVVKGQIFNVGSNEQNFQICQLGDEVRRALPAVEIETTDVAPDLRDYHVSFDKICRVLNFRARHTLTDGIREIYDSIEKGEFGDPMDRKYYNA